MAELSARSDIPASSSESDIDSPEFLKAFWRACIWILDALEAADGEVVQNFDTVICQAIREEILSPVFNKSLCDAVRTEMFGFLNQLMVDRGAARGMAPQGASESSINNALVRPISEFLTVLRPYIEAQRQLSEKDPVPFLRMLTTMASPSEFYGEVTAEERAKALWLQMCIGRTARSDLPDDKEPSVRGPEEVLTKIFNHERNSSLQHSYESELLQLLAARRGLTSQKIIEFAEENHGLSTEELRRQLIEVGAIQSAPTLESSAARISGRLLEAAEVEPEER